MCHLLSSTTTDRLNALCVVPPDTHGTAPAAWLFPILAVGVDGLDMLFNRRDLSDERISVIPPEIARLVNLKGLCVVPSTTTDRPDPLCAAVPPHAVWLCGPWC